MSGDSNTTRQPHLHAQVFAIHELFENILLQLPLSTLLKSNLVSKHWHDTISTSPTIQEQLFFTSSPHYHPPIYNPLLTKLFPPFFQARIQDGKITDIHFDTKDLRQLPWYTDESARDKVLRPEASWRRMYPIAPPAKITSVSNFSGCYCATDLEKGWIKERDQEDGVRMDVLYDVVIEQMDDGAMGGGLSVDWSMFDASQQVLERSLLSERHVLGKNEIRIDIQWQRDCFDPKWDDPFGLVVEKRVRELVVWENEYVPDYLEPLGEFWDGVEGGRDTMK